MLILKATNPTRACASYITLIRLEWGRADVNSKLMFRSSIANTLEKGINPYIGKIAMQTRLSSLEWQPIPQKYNSSFKNRGEKLTRNHFTVFPKKLPEYFSSTIKPSWVRR